MSPPKPSTAVPSPSWRTGAASSSTPRPAPSTSWSTPPSSRAAGPTGSCPSRGTHLAPSPSSPDSSPAPNGAQSPNPEMAFEALFLPDGDGWMPTEASLGPWGADLLHGGAVSALAIALMEEEAHDDYEAVRYSADFVRALPLRKLNATVRMLRKGNRLEVLECDITSDD